jgi:hypothetical protein
MEERWRRLSEGFERIIDSPEKVDQMKLSFRAPQRLILY